MYNSAMHFSHSIFHCLNCKQFVIFNVINFSHAFSACWRSCVIGQFLSYFDCSRLHILSSYSKGLEALYSDNDGIDGSDGGDVIVIMMMMMIVYWLLWCRAIGVGGPTLPPKAQ